MKWIISWSYGHGSTDYEVVEAPTHDDAVQLAYEAWRQNAENEADYGAQPYDKETAVDLGLEDEEEEAS